MKRGVSEQDRAFLCTAIVAGVLLTAGCGGGVDMGAVSGRVTMDGQPVTGVIVTFQPQPPPGEVNASTKRAVGRVDADGYYTMSTVDLNDGAAVGTHTVAINPENRNAAPPGTLPAGFTVEVKPGENEINLELVALGGR